MEKIIQHKTVLSVLEICATSCFYINTQQDDVRLLRPKNRCFSRNMPKADYFIS